MGRFNDFVSQAQPALPVLPLFHTCEGIDFRKILDVSKLDVSPCPHFNQQLLLYFFYGKPAYRPSKDDLATSAPAFMPIAIAVRPESLQTLERVAPFDTGAYFNGMYSSYMHPKIRCDDFLLAPDLQTPGRVVSRFFGSNNNYYTGIPANTSIPPLEFEASSYLKLIQETTRTTFDDRRNTIELQCGNSLRLDANVLLVVLPGVFLDDANLLATVTQQWGAEVRHYRIHHGNPREYASQIYTEVEGYLKANKCI